MAKGKTHPTTWKGFEMRIARTFGTERYSKFRQGEEVPDVVADVRFTRKVILCVECKLRASLSKFVIDTLKEAEDYAADRSKFPESIQQLLRIDQQIRRHRDDKSSIPIVPMAIMKEKYAKDDDSLVVMRFGSLKKLIDAGGSIK